MGVKKDYEFSSLVAFDEVMKGNDCTLLAGVDEAGRGAIAGPVVAAAVICEPAPELSLVRDSKLIKEDLREELYELIIDKAVSWGVGIVEPDEIDALNILNATMKAMKKAVEALEPKPDLVIIDGRKVPDIELKAKAVVAGDRKSFSIAAASIVAKVTRDRIMRRKEAEYPGYGFRQNKGYGTRDHVEAIRRLGRAPIHRRSFTIKSLL